MLIPNRVLDLAAQKGYLNRRDVQSLVQSGISRDLLINVANQGVTTQGNIFQRGGIKFGPNALAELGISSVKGYDPSQFNPAVKYTQTGTTAPTRQTTYKTQTDNFRGYTVPGENIYTVAQPVTLTDAAPAPAATETATNQLKPLETSRSSETPDPQQGVAAALTASINAMQAGVQSQITQQAAQFADIQRVQEERMADLQEQTKQALAALSQRPTVAGVKTATGTGGTGMQIAQRGVSGMFGRGGMRIKSLNV